jgi:hypothetical protein
MIVTVRDPNILSNLDPENITNYLRACGWLKESQIDSKESVWFTRKVLSHPTNMILPYY